MNAPTLSDEFSTSIKLLKITLWVLRRTPRLAVYPMLSLASIAAYLLLLYLVWASTSTAAALAHAALGEIVVYACLAIFGALWIGSFYIAALVRACSLQLRGQQSSPSECMFRAAEQGSAIASYTAMNLLVVVALSLCTAAPESYALDFISGAIWETISLLVLPILIQERRGALDSFRRALFLLSRGWQQLSLGLLYMRMLLGLSMGLAFLFFGPTDDGNMPYFGYFMLSMAVITVGYTLLRTVHGSVLYVYTAEGSIPTPHGYPDEENIEGASWGE